MQWDLQKKNPKRLFVTFCNRTVKLSNNQVQQEYSTRRLKDPLQIITISCNHGSMEWFALEETFKDHLVQPLPMAGDI